jgi:hypothetical protein
MDKGQPATQSPRFLDNSDENLRERRVYYLSLYHCSIHTAHEWDEQSMHLNYKVKVIIFKPGGAFVHTSRNACSSLVYLLRVN